MELIRDIGGWLMLGIAIAGAVSYWVPDGFLSRYANHEMASLFVMLTAGIPLYVCATASTPIAAALVLKGLSPGAALVFLLTGPATNAATIAVLLRTIGRRACAVYLLSIASCSLLLGWLLDRIYNIWTLSTSGWMASGTEAVNPAIGAASALILLTLTGAAFLPRIRTQPSMSEDACAPFQGKQAGPNR